MTYICPKCGSTSVSCGGMNPVQCSARCSGCGFQLSGSQRIGQYFGGKSSYSEYCKEEAESKAKAEREAAESCFNEERRRQQQASCFHEWQVRCQDGCSYEHCIKCGSSRPSGGRKW